MKLVVKIWKAILRNRFFPKVSKHALDFLYPSFCIVCNAADFLICPECIDKLEEKIDKRDPCKICGINLKKQKCGCGSDIQKSYSKVFSLFDYDKELKDIVHAFKYGGLHSMATNVANKFSNKVPSDYYNDIDFIVPVPLHLYRKAKRGYNQAEKLALGVVPADYHIKILNVLHRRRFTGTQTVLKKSERRKNLSGAIHLKKRYKDALKGKRILLIDDVITTGATCDVCAEVLKDAGAKDVRLLSLARA